MTLFIFASCIALAAETITEIAAKFLCHAAAALPHDADTMQSALQGKFT